LVTDFENKIPDFVEKYYKEDAVMHAPGLGTVTGRDNLKVFYTWTQNGNEKLEST